MSSADLAEEGGPRGLGGTVYHGRNGNRHFDEGAPVLRGVGVSNGRDIVFTGGRGRSKQKVTDDTIVFVLKPRGRGG